MSRRAPAPADYPGCPVTVLEALASGRELVPPRWGFGDVLVGAAGYLVLAIAVAGALTALDVPDDVLIVVGTSAPWIAMAGWPLLATARRGNGPRIDLGLRLTWSDCGWGAVGAAAGLFLAGIAALVTLVFVPDLQSSVGEAANEIAESTSRVGLVVFALFIMVGGPVVEEIFFRGLLFGALRKRGLSSMWTVLVTAVVFAAFHFEPTRFFILLPTGLVLGWVRARTGSTGASMIAHGLINSPGAILVLVGLPTVSS